MKTNKYSHLNNVKLNNNFDWQNNMFKKSLPPRAFYNGFTSGFLLAVQRILATGFDTAKYIKIYFRF